MMCINTYSPIERVCVEPPSHILSFSQYRVPSRVLTAGEGTEEGLWLSLCLFIIKNRLEFHGSRVLRMVLSRVLSRVLNLSLRRHSSARILFSLS